LLFNPKFITLILRRNSESGIGFPLINEHVLGIYLVYHLSADKKRRPALSFELEEDGVYAIKFEMEEMPSGSDRAVHVIPSKRSTFLNKYAKFLRKNSITETLHIAKGMLLIIK
jgi:hypothetical protein